MNVEEIENYIQVSARIASSGRPQAHQFADIAAAGAPPFLQHRENHVRHLEEVLTNQRFFRTQFVLIQGGFPLVEDAAYLSLKAHVWIDVSALPFFYPMREFVERLRIYLIYSPFAHYLLCLIVRLIKLDTTATNEHTCDSLLQLL